MSLDTDKHGTPGDHYERAELLLWQARTEKPESKVLTLQRAQVHATLATLYDAGKESVALAGEVERAGVPVSLDERVEAGASAYYAAVQASGGADPSVAWDALQPMQQHSIREAVLPIVLAALNA